MEDGLIAAEDIRRGQMVRIDRLTGRVWLLRINENITFSKDMTDQEKDAAQAGLQGIAQE